MFSKAINAIIGIADHSTFKAIMDSTINVWKGLGTPTFKRAGSAYFDVNGTITQYAADAVRMDTGLYISEPAGSNKCTCYGIIPDDTPLAAITSGAALVVGCVYVIVSRAVLDFTTAGAANNNVATRFVCTTAQTLGAGDSAQRIQWAVGEYSHQTAGVSVLNIPGITFRAGGYSGKLYIADGSALIAAAGLSTVVPNGKVYKYVQGSGGYPLISGVIGANTAAALSAYIAVESGVVSLSAGIHTTGNITGNTLQRISTGSLVALNTGSVLVIGQNTVNSFYFILPQLEANVTTPTSIMPCLGATATRAAASLAYSVSGNLPASGVRHIAHNWKCLNNAVGTQQILWSTRVDANNYTAIWANGTIVAMEKKVAGVSEYVTYNLTPVIGTTYLIEGFIYADNTLGLKVNGVAGGVGTLGSNLVTNGDFATGDATGWTPTAAGVTVVSNQVVLTTIDATDTAITQGVATVIGKQYQINFDKISAGVNTADLQLYVGVSAGGTTVLLVPLIGLLSTGTKTYNFTALSATTYIRFLCTTNGAASMTLDNITIKEIINTSTTLAPQIGSTMHVGGLSDGASSATLVAHAGFDSFNIYNV